MTRISWPGVAMFGLAATAAVLVALFGPADIAKVLAGVAGGLLVRVGAVQVHSHNGEGK